MLLLVQHPSCMRLLMPRCMGALVPRDGRNRLLLSHALEGLQMPLASKAQAQGVGMCVGPVFGADPTFAGKAACTLCCPPQAAEPY